MKIEEAIKRYNINAEYERTHGNLQGCLEFKQLADWLKELKQLMEQTRWIPVSERLPEEYKEVIVTDIETSDTYLSRYIGNGYWECDNGSFNNRIIAWQPKPKPYQSEIPIGAEGSEKETWNGYHGQVIAPKGTFERIFNDADNDI